MRNMVVFFDIGGTLLDSPDIFQAITRQLTGRWPDEPTYKLVAQNYLTLIDSFRQENTASPYLSIVELHRTALKGLAARYGWPDISGRARDICVDTYVTQSTFYPEAEMVLETLKKHAVRMVVASDNDLVGIDNQIPKFNFGRYFSGYCVSETAQAYKPSPGFLAPLKEYLPPDAADGYFVGDSWVDVESGKRLGVRSVLIDRINSGNTYGADYVIHDLQELLPILGIQE
jgi:phosphoglycolate phosphatase-like HAD superfamily hydrolase